MAQTNIFYNRIKNECKKRDMSLNQLERNLGYPRNALNNYQVSNTCPSGIRLIELAEYFNITPRYLLGLEEMEDKSDPIDIFHNLTSEQKKKMYLISQEWLIDSGVFGKL